MTEPVDDSTLRTGSASCYGSSMNTSNADHHSEVARRLMLVVERVPGGATAHANALGVHRATLHRWVTGRTEPTAADVAKVASLAGLPAVLVHYGPTEELERLLPGPKPSVAEAWSMVPRVKEAAKLAGVHRSTVERWLAKNNVSSGEG